MSVTITISTKLYQHLQSVAEDFEPLSNDWCSSNYGGNADDAFCAGCSHGEGELAASIIDSAKANKA
jgi:hypothetical protein